MRIELRWQLLLAAVGILFVISFSGFQIQSSGTCTTSLSSSGGRFVEGNIGQPQYINPLLSDSNPLDREYVDLIFDGLTRYNNEGYLVPALASSWQVSDDGLVYTFEMRDDVFWHDGEPVTAEDVAFTYGILQEEEFPGAAQVKFLWESVIISQTAESEISFILPTPYSPFLEATTRGILPRHILQDVTPIELALHPFNQSPIGSGPFMIVPGNDFQRDGFLRLVPNPRYWRDKSKLDYLEVRFFPDSESMAAAYSNDEIHSLGGFSSSDIKQIGVLPEIRLFSYPARRYAQLLFNFGESASPAIRTAEVRHALVQALNSEEIVDNALFGQAIPLLGPYLPDTWAKAEGLLNNYAFNKDAALASLDSAGWTEVDGSPFREREGEQLIIRLLIDDNPIHDAIAKSVMDQWSNIGVKTDLNKLSNVELPTVIKDQEFDVFLIDVQPNGDPDLYDFWSQEAIIDGQNYGGWNNRRASEALEIARKLTLPEERKPFYEAFLKQYNEDLPAVTLFQYIKTQGVSQDVLDVDIGKVNSPRDRFATFPEWSFMQREIGTTCPEVEM